VLNIVAVSRSVTGVIEVEGDILSIGLRCCLLYMRQTAERAVLQFACYEQFVYVCRGDTELLSEEGSIAWLEVMTVICKD
jgi:hypothetical protein